VIIPPQYRAWGVIPAELFIHDLMIHLKRDYYVGLLSAAAMHGSSHQAPQIFQVMVSRQLRDRAFHRVSIRFYVNSCIERDIEWAIDRKNVSTGIIRVGNPSLTILDLVNRSGDSGGLSSVATLIQEMDLFDIHEIVKLGRYYPRAVLRRLGWMLERYTTVPEVSRLYELTQPDSGVPVLLDSRGPRRGKVDRSWGIRINTTVEPDLQIP